MKIVVALKWIMPACMAVTLIWGCRPPITDGNGEGQDTIPVRGDWVRLAVPNEPDNLHPNSSVQAMSTYVRDQLFQYLTDINPHTLQLEPIMVEALPEISADKLRYTYRMREEATWDDGKPITGHDYAFSIKALMNPLSEAISSRDYYSFIQDVEVDKNDPKRFTVVTKEVFFLTMYALGGMEVLPKHLYDPKGYLDAVSIPSIVGEGSEKMAEDANLKGFVEYFNSDSCKFSPNHIFGSGPYKLESWTPQDKLVLVRKSEWWGDKCKANVFSLKAYPEKIIYKPIKDRAAAVQALGAGEVDIVWDVLPDAFDRILGDSSDPVAKTCNLHLADSYSWSFMGLNTRPPAKRKPVLAEQPVRRALAHLADMDRIIKNVYNGYGSRIVGPISPYNKEEYHTGLKLIDYDVERAKFLLDSAGWKDSNGNGIRDKVINGRKTELEIEFLISNSSNTAPMLGEIMAEDALKAGVKIHVVKEEFKTIAARLGQHDFDMFGLSFNGSPIPGDLKQIWHTESWTSGGTNFTGFGNARTDSLIEKIRVTVDVAERKPMYYAIQEEIYREQPMIFIMSPKERVIINKRFKGQFVTTVRPGFKVRALWVPKEKQQFGVAPVQQQGS